MTTLIVDHQLYTCPGSWSELNWEQFYALYNHFGPPHRTSIETDTHPTHTTAQIMELFCHMEPRTSEAIAPFQRDQFACCLADRFLHRANGYQPSIVPPLRILTTQSLTCGTPDTPLMQPETQSDWEGQPIALHSVHAAAFCSATDLYLNDRWRYGPLIASLLCHPRETAHDFFDEPTILRRARRLRYITMESLSEVFGRLSAAHRRMRALYPKCYASPVDHTSSSHATPTFTWRDLLCWCGHYRITEIDRLNNLNAYDFMELIASRIGNTANR